MMPIVQALAPTIGPTSGGDLVRVVGLHFEPHLEVRFGDTPALVLSVREEAGFSVAEVRTPEHVEGLVSVTLANLDETGASIEGEALRLEEAYLFQRPRVVEESTLTRLIRRLLRMLKAQVLENTALTVSVDYDDHPEDPLRVVAMASLPSLVLSGPTLATDRFYATNVSHEEVVAGLSGPEILRRRPAATVDLRFTLTAATERTAELFNLMAAVAAFFNANTWIEVPRDEVHPGLGTVRWELDREGDYRTNLRGRGDVRVFMVGLTIRGFDIDEGLPMSLARAVEAADLQTQPKPQS